MQNLEVFLDSEDWETIKGNDQMLQSYFKSKSDKHHHITALLSCCEKNDKYRYARCTLVTTSFSKKTSLNFRGWY